MNTNMEPNEKLNVYDSKSKTSSAMTFIVMITASICSEGIVWPNPKDINPNLNFQCNCSHLSQISPDRMAICDSVRRSIAHCSLEQFHKAGNGENFKNENFGGPSLFRINLSM